MFDMEYHNHSPWYYRNRNLLFWLFQLSGWAIYILIEAGHRYFSLSEANYFYHIIAFIDASTGILLSWSLRILFNYFWCHTITVRLLVASAGIIICSSVWFFLMVISDLVVAGKLVSEGYEWWFYGALWIFMSWTILYHGIKYYQLSNSHYKTLQQVTLEHQIELLKRSQAENLAHEAQLKMLRYQLNPHFLFNTLNAISALVQVKKLTKANSMIVQLSQFLRYSLANDPIQMVSLEQEVDALKLYLNIEQTRFGDRLAIEFDIQPECEQINIPSLILQPLAENAIKHGIAPSETGGKLTVQSRLESDFLIIDITDTGPGVALSEIVNNRKTSSGVGLKNTLDRLHAFYGDKYKFNLDSEVGDGFSVHMRLPLEN